MKVSKARLSMLLILVLALAASTIPRDNQPPGSARAADNSEARDLRLSPATHLRIHVAESRNKVKALLDPSAADWNQATPTRILLNRTPRVYQTEQPFTGKIPGLEARAFRAEGKLVVRLEWDDATKNAPGAESRKAGEAGDPDKLYKRPTSATSQFADAVAVMVPENWTGPEFPSLQMGDKKNPVRIFYWNASRGAEELMASGRTTPKSLGHALAHRAEHTAAKWHVTLELPDQAAGTPVAFAVWDGASHDRDGLKFFSIWYVLAMK
jgi:hypothetical protein